MRKYHVAVSISFFVFGFVLFMLNATINGLRAENARQTEEIRLLKDELEERL